MLDAETTCGLASWLPYVRCFAEITKSGTG